MHHSDRKKYFMEVYTFNCLCTDFQVCFYLLHQKTFFDCSYYCIHFYEYSLNFDFYYYRKYQDYSCFLSPTESDGSNEQWNMESATYNWFTVLFSWDYIDITLPTILLLVSAYTIVTCVHRIQTYNANNSTARSCPFKNVWEKSLFNWNRTGKVK